MLLLKEPHGSSTTQVIDWILVFAGNRNEKRGNGHPRDVPHHLRHASVPRLRRPAVKGHPGPTSRAMHRGLHFLGGTMEGHRRTPSLPSHHVGGRLPIWPCGGGTALLRTCLRWPDSRAAPCAIHGRAAPPWRRAGQIRRRWLPRPADRPAPPRAIKRQLRAPPAPRRSSVTSCRPCCSGEWCCKAGRKGWRERRMDGGHRRAQLVRVLPALRLLLPRARGRGHRPLPFSAPRERLRLDGARCPAGGGVRWAEPDSAIPFRSSILICAHRVPLVMPKVSVLGAF